MKYFIGIIVIVGMYSLAFWRLLSGLGDCYTYFFTDVVEVPTGGDIAWAIVRVIPLAEILAVIGFMGGFGIIAVGK